MWERVWTGIKKFTTVLFGQTPVLLPAPPPPPPSSLPPMPLAALGVLLVLIKNARAGHGRPALVTSAKLMAAASDGAAAMAVFDAQSHTAGGTTLLRRLHAAGVSVRPGMLLGEMIGAGYDDPEALMDVQTGWLNSPAHCAILLNHEYVDIGVGVATSAGGTTYWCANFVGTVAARDEQQLQLSGPLTPGASLA